MTEIHRTIKIQPDEPWSYEVHTGEDVRLTYKESLITTQIYFANKAEMKAVALAMLELAEKE